MPSSFSALIRCGVQSYSLGISSVGVQEWRRYPVGLVVNTDIGCRESGRESGRVRRECREALVRLWNIPVTAADTQVGDADVSGRSGRGVTTPLLVGDARPFREDVDKDVRV